MRTEEQFFEWYNSEASDPEKVLAEKVMDFGELFTDMLFRPGTSAYELTKVSVEDPDGSQRCVGWGLPEELESFDYTSYFYKVEELSDCDGYYNHADKTLCVAPDQVEVDATILHEMIHLHESVINDLPMYYHDMVYWALYKDLKEKIPGLDGIISHHAHILTGSDLYAAGGLHDILFLLKSFDLDIRQGYPLGTVFEYDNAFEAYSYTQGD